MIKVGDRIRIKGHSRCHSFIGAEGVVLEIRPPHRTFKYWVHLLDTEKGYGFPLRERDVEKAYRKGEQLLLWNDLY